MPTYYLQSTGWRIIVDVYTAALIRQVNYEGKKKPRCRMNHKHMRSNKTLRVREQEHDPRELNKQASISY